MAGKFNDIELLFIKQVLEQHGEYLSDLFREAIDERDLKKSEELENDIDFSVSETSRGPKLSFSFPNYGRFIEIRYFKKRMNTTIFGFERNNYREQKRKKRKDTQWYARNVYGSLNRLIAILLYELDDKELARLKNIIASGNPLSK